MQEENSKDLRPDWSAAPSDDGHIEDGIPVAIQQIRLQNPDSGSESDSDYEPGSFDNDERVMALQARLDAGSRC